jgi:hypothetical protein
VHTRHEPSQNVAANEAVFEFGRLPDDRPCAGWLLTLVVSSANATSRAQVMIEGWDGLPQSTSSAVWTLDAADLMEGAIRVFVPWSALRVTFSNAGTNSFNAQAKGVSAPIGSSWPHSHYLYNRGTVQSVATGGAFSQFEVPIGATHYRAAWAGDLAGSDYIVQERVGSGGSTQAQWSGPQKKDSREWVSLSVNETPGAQRQIALAQGSGGAINARVEFQFDLWGSMR